MGVHTAFFHPFKVYFLMLTVDCCIKGLAACWSLTAFCPKGFHNPKGHTKKKESGRRIVRYLRLLIATPKCRKIA